MKILQNKGVIWAVLGVLVMILFEAAQQHFYIVRFELADPALFTFWELVEGQFFRWMFWSIFALWLWRYIRQHPIEIVEERAVGRYTLVVLVLIVLNVFVISTFQVLWSGNTLSFESLIDNFVFYAFQKSPIYLISYAVFITVAHYITSTEMLDVHLQELSKLKESHLSLYEELKNKSYADNASLIQVKIGSRIKLVPVDSITWVEADDYCVKIHDETGNSHTIRSTMKALEQNLPATDFIRIHRKAIVNKMAVDEWQLGDEPVAILQNGQHIPISQSRLKKLKSQFGKASLTLKI